MKKNLLIVLFIGMFLLGLTGCGKNTQLIGTYMIGTEDESMYVYYEFTKEGNKEGTCDWHAYLDSYGTSSATYKYELEEKDDNTYILYLTNIEDEDAETYEFTYNANDDTITDDVGTYEKVK